MSSFRTPKVQAIISIDGMRTDFKYLRLNQEMGFKHHEFEILVDHKTFDQNFYKDPEKKLELVFTRVAIDLQDGDDEGKAYCFCGTVTNVRMVAEEGMHGGVLFCGKGNTIELDKGPVCQTYSSTNLATILNEIAGSTLILSTNFSPDWTADIDFAIQHKESDFQFITRLCANFREKCYYSGAEFIIGSHAEFPIREVTYDLELTSLEVCSRLLPNKYTEYFYQRETNTVLKQDAPGDIEGANFFLQKISKQADYLNMSRKPNVPVEAWVPDMGSLTDQVKRRKVAQGADMMYIKGTCKTTDVRIGRVIKVKLPKTAGGSEIGMYRVTKTYHELDHVGRYRCEFEAIPADLKYLPVPEVPVPTISPIQCICVDNVDSQGLGRIKVIFPFDERPCATWIPVMTPDAGGGGFGEGLTKSRGISFLPEIKDTVVCSFLDGATLSQPVIIGSMFHGQNAENLGGGAKNYIKTIITKSGHTIKFDDTKGKEKIQMYDKNMNLIQIDTTANTIDVIANDTINLNATNINLLAKNTITATAGNMFTATAGTTASIAATISSFITAGKEAIFKAGKSLTAKAGKQTVVSSGTNAQLELDSKGNTTLKGKKKVEVNSKQRVKIAGEKQTLVQANEMKIQGKSKTSIKGRQVHVG